MHLVPLGRTGWSLWRWVWLRGAGFPAAQVLPLGSADLHAAIVAGAPAHDVQAIMARETSRIDTVLRDIAGAPLFREAVTWQNRDARRNSVDAYLRSPVAENTRVRERRRVVAKYFQRYAMKNETIGFFGPSVWGAIDVAQATSLRSGGLIRERSVSFENWAIEMLASWLSDRRELWPAFVPRRKPFARLEGRTLHVPGTAPVTLEDTDAILWGRIDGAATADAIAHGDPAAYETLAKLARRGLVSWAIDIPADVEHPERWLRAQLGTLPDGEARAAAIAPLDRIEAAREGVARAAGDAVQLDTAIETLEREFADITGMTVKRGHGQAYAGRQLFYEDCLRDAAFTMGNELVAGIAPALSLVLASARWFTYEIARRFRALVAAQHRELGGGQVPLGALLVATRNIFTGDQYRIAAFVADVQEELHRKWEALLAIDFAAPYIQRHAADLEAAIAETFAAPGPGWPRARHHSPDILIAARDADAIRRGDYHVVLGEVHCGTNTLFARAAYRLHPEREAMKAAWQADLGIGLVQPVQGSADRSTHLSVSDHDFHVDVSWARSWRPPSHVLSAGALVVDDELRVSDGAHTFDIVEVFEHYLCAAAAPHFSLLSHHAHTPRIEIDRLVIARERWHFTQLPRVDGQQPEVVERVMRWANAQGLPRFVFARVPDEAKPVYIDFASPVLVDVLARMLKDAPALSVVELQPDHGALWLDDAMGQRYTSELRVAVVDPLPWHR